MEPSTPCINFYIKSFSGSTKNLLAESFACGIYLMNGTMLHSSMLYIFDRKLKYIKST